MYSNILVPIDTTYADFGWLKKTLEAGYDLSKKAAGVLHIVTVIPDNVLKGYYPNSYSQSVSNDVKAKLKAIVEDMIPADASVQLHVRTGGICPEVLKMAREINASEIVLSSHGPMLKDYVIGSNAGHIALHAPCCVFVIRS